VIAVGLSRGRGGVAGLPKVGHGNGLKNHHNPKNEVTTNTNGTVI
jgi:hypothetical protein